MKKLLVPEERCYLCTRINRRQKADSSPRSPVPSKERNSIPVPEFQYRTALEKRFQISRLPGFRASFQVRPCSVSGTLARNNVPPLLQIIPNFARNTNFWRRKKKKKRKEMPSEFVETVHSSNNLIIAPILTRSFPLFTANKNRGPL